MTLNEAEKLFGLTWEALQAAAWEVRERHYPAELAFAVPGAKRYETEHYRNAPSRFASVSLTGRSCAQQCEHCRGQLLAGMLPASTPQALLELGRRLVDQGAEGLLVSGGADREGVVPLKPYLEAIGRLKAWGLQVLVHTGLLDRETALGLRAAGVDQVLFDVVGDTDTIREVLHLDRTPADYAATLALLQELEVPVAPHVIAGLHFGRLRGELAALEMLRGVRAEVLVLIVLRPLPHTPMAGRPSVDPADFGRLAAVARILHPGTPLTLGCARPAGRVKVELERRAVLAGVNAVAYPDPATVQLARELGLGTAFVESCCTLAVGQPAAGRGTGVG